MALIFLNTEGATLATDSQHFVVRVKKGKPIRLPATMIGELVISSGVEVTRTALGRLGSLGIPAVFLDSQGRIQCRLCPAWKNDPAPRGGQWRVAADPALALAIARELVQAKMANQAAVLSQWLSNHRDPAVAAARDALKESLAACAKATDLDSLRGHEGRAAAVYFPAWGRTLRADWAVFSQRTRQPPRDPVNAMLSYTYAVLVNRMHSLLEAAGLDPYVGTLHPACPRRPSLALDLVEPFRPAVGDRFARRLINLGQIQPEHFEPPNPISGATYLNASGRALFASAFAGWASRLDPEEEGWSQCPDMDMVRDVEAYRLAMRSASPSFRPYRLSHAPAP